ncbi:MAG: Trifunctional nucleotide phosphoesterase protein YfkN precursor [Bacteroidetes bacterium ADurb.Bin141]|nr:MAG: Trifunctional nucleotide phosphoesterase protein YfkN precursor [Bacteroidetes bacterium ADurb.Bin141]
MFTIIKRYFILIFLVVACKTSTIVNKETTVYPLNKPGYTEVDSSILKLYAPYKVKIDSLMNRVIIISDMDMVKNTPEGLLGNITTDATLLQVNAVYSEKKQPVDFCFMNNGGLRASLPKGEITVGNIYTLMPFDNEAVVLTLSGETTEKLLNFIAQKGGMPVSGLQMKTNDSIASDVFIKGAPFNRNKNYVVVTSDYLANGGDNLGFLSENLGVVNTGLKIRDLIIKEFEERNKRGETLKAKIEGRIIHVE